MPRPLLTTACLLVLCLLLGAMLAPAFAALTAAPADQHCCDSCPTTAPVENAAEEGTSCSNCPNCAPCATVTFRPLPTLTETRSLFAELRVDPPPLLYRAAIDYPPEAA